MAQSVTSASLCGETVDLAKRTVERREHMYDCYHPVLNLNGEPMLDGMRDGTCTIRDPRACFHAREIGADIACCYGIPISKDYWDALIWDRRIRNNTDVVLVDTELNTFTLVTAVDRRQEEKSRSRRVDDMFNELTNCSTAPNCGPDNDCLSLNYKFVQAAMNNKRDTPGDPTGTSRRLRTFSSFHWKKYLDKKVKEYQCLRNMDTEQNTLALLQFQSSRRLLGAGQQQPHRRKAIPILMIEYPWGLKSTDDSD